MKSSCTYTCIDAGTQHRARSVLSERHKAYSVQAMVWPVVSLPARKKMKYSCTRSSTVSATHSVDTAACENTCPVP